MRRIRRILALLLTLAFVVACAGCGKEEASTEFEGSFIVLKNKTEMSLVNVPYEIKGTSSEEQIEELLSQLRNYDGKDYLKPVSDDTPIVGWNLDGDQANIYFTSKYNELLISDELIQRAAIVETLCQVEDVKAVCFFVNDDPLTIQGKALGRMTSDMFINGLSMAEATTKLSLYFPDSSCTKLVKEEREVTLNSIVTDEKSVLDELIKGPENEGLAKPIPSGTKVLSIVTKDKTCYVNLSPEFLVYNSEVTDMYTVYSIVNSLCSLPGIASVSFMVGGSPVEFYNTYPINELLIYNNELIPEEE